MSRAERSLLLHRLRDMADEHERLEDEDRQATSRAEVARAVAREDALCADLLREAARAIAGEMVS